MSHSVTQQPNLMQLQNSFLTTFNFQDFLVRTLLEFVCVFQWKFRSFCTAIVNWHAGSFPLKPKPKWVFGIYAASMCACIRFWKLFYKESMPQYCSLCVSHFFSVSYDASLKWSSYFVFICLCVIWNDKCMEQSTFCDLYFCSFFISIYTFNVCRMIWIVIKKYCGLQNQLQKIYINF